MASSQLPTNVQNSNQRHTFTAVTTLTPAFPFQTIHIFLGVFQMIIGAGSVAVSAMGYVVGSPVRMFGTGLFNGAVFFVGGSLDFSAVRANSRWLLFACMALGPVANLGCLAGIATASIERNTTLEYEKNLTISKSYKSTSAADLRQLRFQTTKCSIVLGVCAVEFIITLVHFCLSVISSCRCCCPSQHEALANRRRIVTSQVRSQPLVNISPPPFPADEPPLPPYPYETIPSAPPTYSEAISQLSQRK